jgi:acyl-CoA synthetase (AMP-forming)/AMP-acid ligase II
MTLWRHGDEGRLMKWLIAVLAAFGAAAVAGVVFRWMNPKAASSAWHHATDAATNATAAAADATSAAANEVKQAVSP